MDLVHRHTCRHNTHAHENKHAPLNLSLSLSSYTEGNVLLGTKGWDNPNHPSLGFLDKAYHNTLTILPFILPSNHAISPFFSHLPSTFLYSYWLIFSALVMLVVPSDVRAGWWQTWISVPAVLGFVSLNSFLWAFSHNVCTLGIFTHGFLWHFHSTFSTTSVPNDL